MKPRFNYARMRQQFYAWHGGQDSPLYAAASSGLVADVTRLQVELRQCAESLWNDASNFKFYRLGMRTAEPGRVYQSSMKAKPYAEWLWLRKVADSLESILTEPMVHPRDGKEYRALPWADFTPVV